MPALPVSAAKFEEPVAAAVAVATSEVDDDITPAPGAALTKNQKKRLKEKEAKAKAVEAALKQVAADPACAALSDAEKLERATALVAAAKAAAKAEAGEPEAAAEDDEDPTNPYPRVGKSYKRQTWPEPTVPVRKQFSPGAYPKGEEMPHPLECNAFRTTSEEKRAMERLMSSRIDDLRQAAEVHRQVRTWAKSWIKPGIPLLTITDRIEKKLEELIGKNGLKAGQAFPTGVSLNHIAAHYTSNSGDKTIYGENDVLKVDFGTQINGHIIDCAWTEYTNPRYDPLAEAVKAATNEGLKQAGIDARLGDVGAAIQEVMESYEVELDGKTYRVKSIGNLSGHSIDQYVIHGGKSVPIVKRHEPTKMEEGELYAIETFGSTGRGSIIEDGECSHYMARPGGASSVSLRSDGAKTLMKHIDQQFGTLAFCRKWLDQKGHDRHMLYLKQIVDSGAVNPYPPLIDVKGSYTAQMEHTILLKPTGKEVLSRGLDY